MEKHKRIEVKIIQYILEILMIGAFGFFLWGQLALPPENESKNTTFQEYDVEWIQVLSDGGQKKITVPGMCEAGRGEWVMIASTIPQLDKDTCVCIRSMQQDFRIYVGEELRKEYSTIETQLFGKTSTMTYVFFELYQEDAGKQLRIEFMSDSSYSGYVSEMFMGEKYDIVRHFFCLYAPSAVIALLVILIGLFVSLGSVFVRCLYKREVDLIHLGNGILIAAMWLLVESRLRQFIFPNSTIAMLTGFLMVALLPYPIMSYINSIQQYRYKKAYNIIGTVTVINFIVVVMLQILNVKDFFETMTISHIIIVALMVIMVITIGIDIKKGYIKEYREVAIGFACLMLAGVCEIGLTYTANAQMNGIALCIGLVVLLITAGLKSIRDLFNIEKEKQIAIAASESRAKFLANMSHEIRTPINTVIGMNEMILRENRDETVDEYAQNIKNASQMLLGLINDVLDMSKIEAGRIEIHDCAYDLKPMLQDVILGVETRIKQKNLELKLEIDETMPSVLKGDEIRVKQILNNLLSNAVKYTEEGSITLSVQGITDEKGFSLECSVKDTGIGIREEDMKRLFDSFQRLEMSKNRYVEGTGLGLNITKQLIDIMEGSITVQSEYGIGSCFTVQIPQQIEDTTAMGALNQNQKSSQDNNCNENSLSIPEARILIVDDTRMNLKVIAALLKRSQAQLDLAPGGKECFAKTQKKQYDLILMDHMMPEPDGIETLHMIREDEGNPNVNTPIVVLTANAIAGMKEQYLEEGFADYLSKPVDVEQLEATLSKFLLNDNKEVE